jgi:hypothetical protein
MPAHPPLKNSCNKRQRQFPSHATSNMLFEKVLIKSAFPRREVSLFDRRRPMLIPMGCKHEARIPKFAVGLWPEAT